MDVGPNYTRKLAQAQTESFQVEHYVQVPAGSGFRAHLLIDGRVHPTGTGPEWTAGNGKFFVRDGDGNGGGPMLDTGFPCKPGQWYKVTLRIDVAKRTWEFAVDDKRFEPSRPLGFRTKPAFLDGINFSVEQGAVYFDALRITGPKATTKAP